MKNSVSNEIESENTEHSFNTSQDAPDPVYATIGNMPGEIFLQWDSIKSANKYMIEISLKYPVKWQQVDIVKDPVYNFTGLKPSTEYLFRVAAVYPEGTGKWSRSIIKKTN